MKASVPLVGFTVACLLSRRALDTEITLPAPTGPFAVGRIAYHWTDSSRPEPLSAQKGARREVMVYVWYPAEVGANAQTAPYLPNFSRIEKAVGEADMKTLLG